MTVMEYLVIDDNRPNSYQVFSRLVARGRAYSYTVRSKGFARTGKYFHVEHKIGERDQSPEELLAGFLRIMNVNDKEVEFFDINPLLTSIGFQYGRIARPIDASILRLGPKLEGVDVQELLDWYSQLDSFMYRLQEIFRVIYPSEDNFSVHGYEIRNLLLLACAEVELLFKRMIWDDYRSVRSNMFEFFKSHKFAHLSHYRIRFNSYPSLGVLEPFRDWHEAENYIPLEWYQAYNATKHGRVHGSDGANLKSLVNAIAACVVLIKAQDFHAWFSSKKPASFENFKVNFDVDEPKWHGGQNYWRIAGRPLRILPGPDFKTS